MNRIELLKIAKPIPFNTDGVQALRDGRMTTTRRVIMPQPTYNKQSGFSWKGFSYGTDLPPTIKGAIHNFKIAAPYHPGDILYVRETYYEDENCVFYKADNPNLIGYRSMDGDDIEIKWKPSVHMPKKIARIFLLVTDVRVERLQDITPEQIVAEGITGLDLEDLELMEGHSDIPFAFVWDMTLPKTYFEKYRWSKNPWVWIFQFERVLANE